MDKNPPAAGELARRLEHLHQRTRQYLELGHDRLAAAAFAAEGAGEGPGLALDVGTGKGLLAMALARRGFDVVSVDPDPAEQEVAFALAREAGLQGRIAFERAGAEDLPYAGGSFDVVASLDALHHLPAGGRALEEMARVLRPGGRLVLAEFTEEGFALVERVHAAEGRHHGRGDLTLEWASGFLAGRGFSLEARGEAHHTDRRVFRRPGDPGPAGGSGLPPAFEAMDLEERGKALSAFARNWLAHDGCWFLAAEEALGLSEAMALDAAAWRRFAEVEAKRIAETFGPLGRGLRAVEKALGLRMYALLNPQETEWVDGGRALRLTVGSCRVQEARRRKNLPPFPCRPVGEVEFSTFAKTLDPEVEVRCLRCPPKPNEGGACTWEFTRARPGEGAKGAPSGGPEEAR
ncbi:MAG: DUF6125 family protein [Acidobacteriota bacterium]